MVDWYMKGGAVWDNASYRMWLFLKHAGFPEANYDSINIDDDGDIDDPFMEFGGVGGVQQVEIGLIDGYRIRITSGGVEAWNDGESQWVDLLTGGGGSTDLDATPDSDQTVSGITVDMVAGENLAFGNVCYMKNDGKLWKSDADAVGTMPIITMAAETILADATGSFLLMGFARDDAWTWTVGGMIYGSTALGGITQTCPAGAGDVIQGIGIATHADRMLFKPDIIYIIRQ